MLGLQNHIFDSGDHKMPHLKMSFLTYRHSIGFGNQFFIVGHDFEFLNGINSDQYDLVTSELAVIHFLDAWIEEKTVLNTQWLGGKKSLVRN